MKNARPLPRPPSSLTDLLADGPVPAKKVKAAAKAAEVSEITLRRAKDRLGVVAKKTGKPGETDQAWTWSLPEGDH